MDQITGELRTVSITEARDGKQDKQQKIQILSDSSQFGGEWAGCQSPF